MADDSNNAREFGDQPDGAGADEVELDESELEAVGVGVGESQPRPSARTSVPPPLPPQARRLDPLRTEGSRSGTWRIAAPAASVARGGSAPPPDPAALQRRLSQLEQRSREERALIARLRLGAKMRDDRIVVLEAELAEARARVAALERAEAERPPDDLKRINGIGPAYERALRGLGVGCYSEIAAWSADDVARVANALGATTSRVEPWIAQARELST